MANRPYGHYCGLAHALELVGERWTLLLIRELLTGPKRNRDLMQRVPGIGSSVLAKRLKHLLIHGLITSEAQPPPASSWAYVLTEKGRSLEPLLISLAQWGYAGMKPGAEGGTGAPGAAILALQANYCGRSTEGIAEEYEFHVGTEVFHLRAGQPSLGPAGDPACTVRMASGTFWKLLTGQVTVSDVIRHGTLRIQGAQDARHRCMALLDFTTLRKGRHVPMVDLTGSRLRRVS